MTQTKTYKLNLIEMSDTFSPDPINENAQKIEQELQAARSALDAETAARQSAVSAGNSAWQAALDSEIAARKSADSSEASIRQSAITALDGRVKTMEAKKMVVGTYDGAAGDTRTISLGFTPKFVLLTSNISEYLSTSILTPGHSVLAASNNRKECAKIVANGFQVIKFTSMGSNLNVNPFDQSGMVYTYVAFD